VDNNIKTSHISTSILLPPVHVRHTA